ncbi:MAG: DNA repair protein RadA [Desulfobacterales bacterium]|nr:DNA repair protein RadA [Desulfobacterales bacterium]
MSKPSKTVYICNYCGYQVARWMGKCPECGHWDSMVESQKKSSKSQSIHNDEFSNKPVPIDSIDIQEEARLLTGVLEFDRVLGGGIVNGTLILIGGDPGIGKSTLMLQVLHRLSILGNKTLYVTGEESVRQIKIRSNRLNSISSNLLVLSEIDLDHIISLVQETKPSVLVIDSIQTMFNSEIPSAPGTVTQVRESTMRLMIMAKKIGVSVFIIGHVTKDGSIAGPRIMEHMVDTVLYFEGDRNHVFRILRAVKNRFGSTNEIGVFEMKEKGLMEITNPSAMFLSERPENTAGSTVTACMEGTRPILVELQGLASPTSLGTPRRTILGLDHNRVALLLAVMEKKLGIHLVGHDIFMNVAGGVKIIEPGVDMCIIAAIASSFLDKSVISNTVIMGEVGLTGEVRAISHIESRVNEIKKMGFTQCIMPKTNMKQIGNPSDIEIIGISDVSECMKSIFGVR